MYALCTPERINGTADISLHFSATGTVWAIIQFYETHECVAVPLSHTARPLIVSDPSDLTQLC